MEKFIGSVVNIALFLIMVILGLYIARLHVTPNKIYLERPITFWLYMAFCIANILKK